MSYCGKEETKLGKWVLTEAKEYAFTTDDEKAAKRAFDEAMEGWCGASYIPVWYAGFMALAGGIRYMFICDQTLVTEKPSEHLVEVVIGRGLAQKPLPAKILSISKPII